MVKEEVRLLLISAFWLTGAKLNFFEKVTNRFSTLVTRFFYGSNFPVDLV